MKLLIFPSSFQTWQGVGVGYGQGQEGGQTEHYFSFLLQTVGHYSIFKLNKIWSFEPKDIYPLPPANFLVTLPPPDFGIFLCILILVIILKNFCIDETNLSLTSSTTMCQCTSSPLQGNDDSSHHPKTAPPWKSSIPVSHSLDSTPHASNLLIL